MLKTVLLAAAAAGFLAVGLLPLNVSPAQAGQITCREAAKLEYPKSLMKRFSAGLQGRLESAQAQPTAASAESLTSADCRATHQSRNQH